LIQQITFRVFAYTRHALRSLKSKKGYGVHSPFAFDFITSIINPESISYYYCFSKIEQLRRQCEQDHKKLTLANGKASSLLKIARQSASPSKDGQLLFRTALAVKAKRIIELGTSIGLGTSYLASASKESQVISIDHNASVLEIAKRNIKSLGINNVSFIQESIDTALIKALKQLKTVDLVFLDGNHVGEATKQYFNTAKEFTHSGSVFIFHDIHWSKDMYDAWVEITKDNKVSSVIECYNVGFVFFNRELKPQHFYA